MKPFAFAILLFVVTLPAVSASAQAPTFKVVVFHDWKTLDPHIMQKYHITPEFVRDYAVGQIEAALNTQAPRGWEPVQMVFVPGTSGAENPRLAADKIVIVMRKP
jgi:hypothetical protein